MPSAEKEGEGGLRCAAEPACCPRAGPGPLARRTHLGSATVEATRSPGLDGGMAAALGHSQSSVSLGPDPWTHWFKTSPAQVTAGPSCLGCVSWHRLPRTAGPGLLGPSSQSLGSCPTPSWWLCPSSSSRTPVPGRTAGLSAAQPLACCRRLEASHTGLFSAPGVDQGPWLGACDSQALGWAFSPWAERAGTKNGKKAGGAPLVSTACAKAMVGMAWAMGRCQGMGWLREVGRGAQGGIRARCCRALTAVGERVSCREVHAAGSCAGGGPSNLICLSGKSVVPAKASGPQGVQRGSRSPCIVFGQQQQRKWEGTDLEVELEQQCSGHGARRSGHGARRDPLEWEGRASAPDLAGTTWGLSEPAGPAQPQQGNASPSPGSCVGPGPTRSVRPPCYSLDASPGPAQLA